MGKTEEQHCRLHSQRGQEFTDVEQHLEGISVALFIKDLVSKSTVFSFCTQNHFTFRHYHHDFNFIQRCSSFELQCDTDNEMLYSGPI